MAGLRATTVDTAGNLWIGTYGGGAAVKAEGSDDFTILNRLSEPALKTNFVSAICADSKGGVYIAQNTMYDGDGVSGGLAYLKDGSITNFTAEDVPATIPDNYVQDIKIDDSGIVWIATFGGLTRYDPEAGSWQTWSGAADGLPAVSATKIEFDGQGGLWVGFYPYNEDGDPLKPMSGGFAHFRDGKVTASYSYITPKDGNTDYYRASDIHITDIAVEDDGGAWFVSAGSMAGMSNTGGKVYHVDYPGADAERYSGFDLFGESAFTRDSELIKAEFDPDGGLWFSTTKDGIWRVKEPVIRKGRLSIRMRYSSAEGSWDDLSSLNNVRCLDFHGDTLYAGSEGGLAVRAFTFGKAAAAPGKASVKVKAGRRSAALSWKKVSGADGYEVYRSLKKSSGFKKAGTVKGKAAGSRTVRFNDKKLKAGKTYYYRLRAYKNVDGEKVCGAWSAVKKVKTK